MHAPLFLYDNIHIYVLAPTFIKFTVTVEILFIMNIKKKEKKKKQ